MKLEDYMAKHIWKPLGINSTTFRLKEHTNVTSHLVDMANRDPTTGGMEGGATMGRDYPEDDFGGSGLYSNPADYIKLLTSILRNDEAILRKETVKMMFTPQLPDPKYLMSFTAKQERHFQLAFLGGLPLGTSINWGLCGLLNMENVPGMRSQGSLSWTGLPNLFWVCEAPNQSERLLT
jgi:CubicO group peptidase (beta-lactamase class C family)